MQINVIGQPLNNIFFCVEISNFYIILLICSEDTNQYCWGREPSFWSAVFEEKVREITAWLCHFCNLASKKLQKTEKKQKRILYTYKMRKVDI